MSGPYPGQCPACNGPKNSYVLYCHFCDVLDENHYITGGVKVVKIPTNMSRKRRLQWQEGLANFVS